MPSVCRPCFKRASPGLIIKDACSGGSLMNKSLGRDYDWCCKQTGRDRRCCSDRRRSRPAESEKKAARRYWRVCAAPRCWQSIHVLFALSKHNFPSVTLRRLSVDGAAEPSVPLQLLKMIFFCVAGFGLATEVSDAQGGNRETFQTIFFTTTTFEIDFTYCKFAWVATVILEGLKGSGLCLSTCSIMAAIAACNKVNMNISFPDKDLLTQSLPLAYLVFSVMRQKQQKPILHFVLQFCNHNSSSTEPNFLVELTYKHSVLSCCPCWLKGKHAAIPSVSLPSPPCKNGVIAKTK